MLGVTSRRYVEKKCTVHFAKFLPSLKYFFALFSRISLKSYLRCLFWARKVTKKNTFANTRIHVFSPSLREWSQGNIRTPCTNSKEAFHEQGRPHTLSDAVEVLTWRSRKLLPLCHTVARAPKSLSQGSAIPE